MPTIEVCIPISYCPDDLLTENGNYVIKKNYRPK